MNIQSIKAFSPAAYAVGTKKQFNSNPMGGGLGVLSNSSNVLLDKNYNSAFINFRGKEPVSRAKSTGEKINTALGFVGTNDIVLVGKDINSARENLLDSAKSLPKMLNRVYFIKDKDAKSSYMIASNTHGIPYIQNLGITPLYQDADDGAYKIMKGQQMFVHDGGKFKSGEEGKYFSINPIMDATVDDLKNAKVEVFDFNGIEISQLVQINKQRISTMGVIPEVKKEPKKFTFADVGGQDKAIKELKESVVYPIKYPEAFNVINHGVILYGGPGTGKTLLAEALANEVDANFIKLNGLEMESKWVGDSEKNWRDLFEEARSKQPCIVFIDEFDAVARKREGSETSRHDDKTVNQLLTLMSDLEKSGDQIYVIAATNKKDIMDDAILRSGRFGKQIEVPNPDLEGCRMIFDIHTKNKKIDRRFNSKAYTEELHKANASGADIADIVERAQNGAYQRAGIFEKMEDGTFTMSDIARLRIKQEDFDEALKGFKSQNKPEEEERRPIGYGRW